MEYSKPDLLAKGTRYDHYMELKEVFMTGLNIINSMNPAHVSASEREKKTQLQHAVELITKRLDYLSDFVDETEWGSDLAREVRDIDIKRKKGVLQLTEGSDAKPESQGANQTDSAENPST